MQHLQVCSRTSPKQAAGVERQPSVLPFCLQAWAAMMDRHGCHGVRRHACRSTRMQKPSQTLQMQQRSQAGSAGTSLRVCSVGQALNLSMCANGCCCCAGC